MTVTTTETTWSNLPVNRTSLLSLGNQEYQYYHQDWLQLLDTIEGGEREVKERGEEYLPKTSGMEANKQSGDKVYEAYKKRSNFYAYAKDTLPSMLGVMHAKPPKIELPSAIKEMNADAEDPAAWRVGLSQVLREINKNQLEYGRLGLLSDIPAVEVPASEVRPKILMYEAF